MDIPATNGVVQVVENIIEMDPRQYDEMKERRANFKLNHIKNMFYLEELIQSKEMTEWETFKTNYVNNKCCVYFIVILFHTECCFLFSVCQCVM